MDRPDFWRITFEERTKHNLTFNQLNPENGQYLNGEQARNFMLKSGLSAQILADIWNLSDINKDGKLDRKEFSIACSFIKKVLTTGCKLPNVLPSSILIDPLASNINDNTISSSSSPIFSNNSFVPLQTTTTTISPINVTNVNRPLNHIPLSLASSTPIQTQPPTT
jgi:intersectin